MHGKKRIAVQQAAAPTPAEDVALLRRRLGGSIARKDEAAAIDRIAAALASAEERIQAAVLEERSAAARLCETAALPFPMEWWNDTKKGISAKTATALAAAIRARGGA